MLAGGCVRDRLFGLEPKDYDLATTARPERVIAVCEAAGYKVVPTGLAHGTVSVITERQMLEVTTLRTDVVCDGRHAEIAYAEDFSIDAHRRDFTVNALFEDADGHIHDYVDGQRDLHARRLRFVGDPRARIREDYLRGLRYFRFLARWGWPPIPDQLTAIEDEVAGMARLSIERIQSEMDQILAADHVSSVLPLLVSAGVTATLFPFVRPDAIAETARLLTGIDHATLRWFVFYHHGSDGGLDEEALAAELSRMRFTRKQNKALGSLFRLVLLEDGEEQLGIILQLHEQGLVPATDLASYLTTAGTYPDLWLALASGLTTRPEPPIPNGLIMALTPPERGLAVRTGKLYAYLGLCRNEKELKHIFDDLLKYREFLRDGTPPRVVPPK